MKFERIMHSGIIVDGMNPGGDPRLTLRDIAFAMGGLRWGGHHPDRVTIGQHSVAMSLVSEDPLDKLACLWHDAAEIFVADLPTTLKHQPEMAWYRDVERACQASLVARFAPALVGYDWSRIKQLDRAALVVESRRFPGLDRHWHEPFGYDSLNLTWEHYVNQKPWSANVFSLRSVAE